MVATSAKPAILVATGLTREMKGNLVFHSIDLELSAGEILFVCGRSGCGKTTLLRSLAMLDPLQGGRVTFKDRTLKEVGAPAWRTEVCYVSQSSFSGQETPENVFCQVKGFAAQKCRKHLDLEETASAVGLPIECLKQNWAEMSGGQRQRASLAIALALQPEVLLLDEPTSALDPESVAQVEGMLRAQVNAGKAIIWISHSPEQIQRIGGRVLNLSPAAMESPASMVETGSTVNR
mmetsp:Transcript_25677/g.42996  ORF Transcript_25677/g.42996 Transcript_25677/m.42996 type:complete len:235 (-) Transcript_25677:138-842(-)|eukprot:CAMPEP_0198210342 /NCGR_PEP_ID=MMETSP1445-20131203/20047_1 /TAXON_ID=36898 /ORGANISM="Pyramimonas sp., Strain CCMP2087" /LENGTH=234 /DNA_ID=CAMNT_0043884385 /DNA_START=122 /DNA_END=826 /DNA_ORIENTATION=-